MLHPESISISESLQRRFEEHGSEIDLYQALLDPNCNPAFMAEYLFYCPRAALDNVAIDLLLFEDLDLISKAVKHCPVCSLDEIDVAGLDPDHEITQAAIALNAEIQICLDAADEDNEGAWRWSVDPGDI
jgi:hypothetical protein